MLRFKPLEKELAWRGRSPFEDAWRGIHNPFVCHFGTSEHTTTETQKNDPWAPQQPYLTQGFGAAQNLLNNPLPQQQNPVAPFNSAQNDALSSIISSAMGGTPISSSATGFANNLESGNYLNANPASGFFSSLMAGGGPGSDTLKKYADGGYFSNGYSDDTAQNVMSQVVPQISSIFNRGNNVNNPALARAAASGVTSALAPIEYQNYQTQEGLQADAAKTLGTQALAGAAGNSGAWQDTLAKMVQGNALAPQNQALSFADMQQLFNAGNAQQTQAQNEAGGQAASYNFSQMAPYQQLAAYMQAVTGNYGGTQATTKPYYTNDTANTLGTVSSLGSLAALAFL